MMGDGVLSAEERAAPKAVPGHPGEPHGVARRANAILLLDKGWSGAEVTPAHQPPRRLLHGALGPGKLPLPPWSRPRGSTPHRPLRRSRSWRPATPARGGSTSSPTLPAPITHGRSRRGRKDRGAASSSSSRPPMRPIATPSSDDGASCTARRPTTASTRPSPSSPRPSTMSSPGDRHASGPSGAIPSQTNFVSSRTRNFGFWGELGIVVQRTERSFFCFGTDLLMTFEAKWLDSEPRYLIACPDTLRALWPLRDLCVSRNTGADRPPALTC